ncbi:hypothetical protein PMAYCL1PPCAC_29283, partial [Pristionchus mayeri]
PALAKQGLHKQALFNVSILNCLEEAKSDPAKLQGAINMLVDRNSLLELADKNPKAFELADTMKALESASSSSSNPSSMLHSLLLVQSLSQSNDRKRRAPSPPPSLPQPFRQRAPAFGQPGALSSFARPPPLFDRLPVKGSASGSQQNFAPVFCRLCGQYGHLSYYCPSGSNNRSSAVREEQFVTGEVVRLLASGAIEKCGKPRVVSPLSVVQGNSPPSRPNTTPPRLRESKRVLERYHIHHGQLFIFPGEKGETLRDLSEKISKVDSSLSSVLGGAVEGSKAPSTIRAYSSNWQKLAAYAKEKGLDPSCPSSLIIYTLRRLLERKSLSSVRVLSAFFFSLRSPFVISLQCHFIHDSRLST